MSGNGNNVETRIARLEERLDAAERARDVALTAMDRRLDGMNEFRNTLRDQQNTFLRTDQYSMSHENLAQQIAIVRSDLTALRIKVETGSAAMTGRWLGYAALGAVFVTVVAGLLVHLVDGLVAVR
jgi:hypothetical protein